MLFDCGKVSVWCETRQCPRPEASLTGTGPYAPKVLPGRVSVGGEGKHDWAISRPSLAWGPPSHGLWARGTGAGCSGRPPGGSWTGGVGIEAGGREDEARVGDPALPAPLCLRSSSDSPPGPGDRGLKTLPKGLGIRSSVEEPTVREWSRNRTLHVEISCWLVCGKSPITAYWIGCSFVRWLWSTREGGCSY